MMKKHNERVKKKAPVEHDGLCESCRPLVSHEDALRLIAAWQVTRYLKDTVTLPTSARQHAHMAGAALMNVIKSVNILFSPRVMKQLAQLQLGDRIKQRPAERRAKRKSRA